MLKTTTLKDLDTNWSVSYQLNKLLNTKRNEETVSLKEIMFEQTEKIHLKDDQKYTRVKVLWHHKGLTKRDTVFGYQIKNKIQKVIKENQFLISKIDARNGAFGIVPNELDGSIITEEFKTFEVDTNKVDLDFLNYFIATDYFLDKVKALNIGHTFRRTNMNLFLDQKIALPPIEEQKELVSKLKELEIKEKELKADKEKELNIFANTFFN